jgi:hypothetical protein
MGKSGYHALKFHQNMDGVIKVSKFQPLSFCKMRNWYLGCVETFYWSFSTSLLVILLSIQPFHVFPSFFCVVTSSSFFSITNFLQFNISSCIVNVSFNHMHFVVLVSIWGILVCILDLICVFVVTLVGLNSVFIVTNVEIQAQLVKFH